jgi:dCMP deaminase
MLEIFSDMVELLSKRSTCSSRVAVGALLFDDHNRIVGTGYNGSPSGLPHCDDVGCAFDTDNHCRRAIHAEVNAILQCAQFGVSTRGLQLFCTHSPCVRCAGIIVQAGIVRVYYINQYQRDFYAAKDILRAAGVALEYYPF